MDAELYPQVAALEDAHWWFVGRRAICAQLLDRIVLPADALILDVGCGTGGNFSMLARRGQLYAIDPDASALRFAAARGLARLARGCLPSEFPFTPSRFHLVVMTDVLEHLDDDLGSLRTVASSLVPGGWLLTTVPAFNWLWSQHDVAHHHRRRYRAAGLRSLLTAAGFKIDFLSYYNSLLFPAIALVRLLQNVCPIVRKNRAHDLTMPWRYTNSVLFRIFSLERFLLGRFRLPLGVSLIALARI